MLDADELLQINPKAEQTQNEPQSRREKIKPQKSLITP